MKTALQISAYIGITLGILAILGSFAEPAPDRAYSFIGGLLFFVQGCISLAYINEVKRGEI